MRFRVLVFFWNSQKMALSTYLEFVFGCIFIIAFAGLMISACQLMRPAIRAEGRVLCIEKHKGIDGVRYAPIVDFIWEGEIITLENLPKSWQSPKVKPGELVPIYFDGWKPSRARITPTSMPFVVASALGLLISTLFLMNVKQPSVNLSASEDTSSRAFVGVRLQGSDRSHGSQF